MRAFADRLGFGTRRSHRFLLPFAGFVFVAGIVAVLIAFNAFSIRNTAHPYNPPLSSQPATPAPTVPKTVPVERTTREAAAAWIRASVGRSDLVTSWNLTAPELKRGFTLAQWKTGNIPVIPYPIDKLYKGLGSAPFKIDWSYPREAMLEIVLVPRTGLSIKPQTFFIGLRRYGNGSNSRWLVYYWQPRGFPPRPSISSN